MFTIGRHPSYSHFIVLREGTGAIPDVLSGLFTDTKIAQDAIDNYEVECSKVAAKKEEADKKQKEALAKPLGHTQRKKPNAKKPSTSGK